MVQPMLFLTVGGADCVSGVCMCLEDGAAFALLDGRWRWLRLSGRFRVYPVDDESHDVQSEVHAVWLGVEEAAVV